ncbi:MAG: putative RNA methyltransferase-domain-containing protein [Monoraphidium minutum]|nr:MAG: putative RNA methyltransferase-domain-containing protein [Monoraphidium minutum]
MGAKKDKQKKRKAGDGEGAADAAAGDARPAAAAAAAPGAGGVSKKARKSQGAEQEQTQEQQQQQGSAKKRKGKAEPPPAEAARGDNGGAAAAAGARAQGPGRRYTVTMAVPGSMIDNTQSFEMANFVAGQVARTAAVFNVDELVIIDDTPQRKDGTVGAGAAFLARVCQYLETPQYLRKALIPMHPDLRLAGILPPLDAPHHLRASEWQPFREGVVLKAEEGSGSFVDVGLDRTALVEGPLLAPNARVTLRLGPAPRVKFVAGYGESMLLGEVVLPSAPREEAGLYWGYATRLAKGVSGLVRGAPFEGGYDLKLGTSEHGEVVLPGNLELPRFRHLLIAFGGPDGLEAALSRDKRLQKSTTADIFDAYLNTCPDQGSRTIRTEEAVLISMAFLQTAVSRFGER